MFSAATDTCSTNRAVFSEALIRLLASCDAVYCNRYCLCVGGSVTNITRNCVHRSSPNWVYIDKGSDHLQMIKFWPSCAPGKGVSGGAKVFGSTLLQRAVFASPLGAFIIARCNRTRGQHDVASCRHSVL